MNAVYATLEGRGFRVARMERARLDRPPGAVAAVEAIRPDEPVSKTSFRNWPRDDPMRQPPADRRHPVRKMGIPGGTRDQDPAAWSTRPRSSPILAEQGHDFAKKILEWRQVSK